MPSDFGVEPQTGWLDRRTRSRRTQARRCVLLACSLAVSLCVVVLDHRHGFAETSSPLPFDMPAATVLDASPKHVFAHYMTPFPLSIDNRPAASDYYTQQYLNPAGESGAHASSGGFIRDRPLPRSVDTSGSWALNDLKTEVSRASAAGIDGFSVDILTLSGPLWDRLGLMMQAARAVDPNFKILVMPDVSAGVAANSGALAAAVARLAADPAAYRLSDGRLVVSPFYAEGKSADWWRQWIATMQSSYGISIAFVPTFLDSGNMAAFDSISYGFSEWGGRSPASIGAGGTVADAAHKRGKIWMQPVAVQDERPTGGVFDEAGNTETLRGMWGVANANRAEWVQLLTWNDYAEGTEISPSSRKGWAPLDLVTAGIVRFKTGLAPAIVRDVIYLSHRTQRADARPTGGQTQLMQLRPGSSPARDVVEVMTFLTRAATVSVQIGATQYAYNAPAGGAVSNFPLAEGSVTATLYSTAGTALQVTSPAPVVSNPVVQDLSYVFASSGRTGSVVNAVAPTSASTANATAIGLIGDVREPVQAPAATPAPSSSPLPSSAPATQGSPSSVAPTPILTAAPLADAGGFTPVTPFRLADTRSGLAGPRLDSRSVRRIQVAGVGVIPSGVTAISANVTAVRASAGGYLSAFPCTADVPSISTVNFAANETVANAAMVALDSSGSMCVFANVSLDVVIDVNGYVDAAGAGRLVPTAPQRLFDTRDPTGPVRRLIGGEPVEVGIVPTAGVPEGATAVVLNLTAVGAAAATYVTVDSCAETRPLVSSINVANNQPQANSAIVPLSTEGSVCFYSPSDVDLVVDIAGYMIQGAGLRFTPVSATRLVDTRDPQPMLNLNRGGRPVDGGSVQTIAFAGLRGIPAEAQVVSGNMTTTASAASGYLSVWPCTATRPTVSSLNTSPGRSVAAAVMAPLSAQGASCVYIQASTQLVVDVNGYWAN